MGDNGLRWTTEKRKLADLKPQQDNPRQIREKQVERLVTSWTDYGQVETLAVGPNGEIYNGHQRYHVMLDKFGPDYEVVCRVASRPLEHKEWQRLTVLLHEGATGEWNFDELANWDVEVDDLVEWGFTEEKLGLAGWNFDDEPGDAPEPQIDRAAELQEKWQVQRGQVWEIPSLRLPGKCHRVMCGDSTNAGDVGRLMGNEKAKLFATDPPYGCDAGNIGFTAQRDDIEAITKDNLQGEEMQAFLESVFRVWIPHLTLDCAWYLWHPMLTQGYFAAAAAAAAAADLIIHRQIIWKKEQFIFGRGDYHWRHELCFYGWRQGNRPQFYGERNQDTVWEMAWGTKRSETGHPTAKPPGLFVIPMRNHLKRGDLCAEPFLGSGSQLVACEQTARIGYGMEICEKYVSVSLQRLEDLGLEPRLADG